MGVAALLLLGGLLAASGLRAQHTQPRGLAVGDLFENVEILGAAMAPDGDLAVVEVRRPMHAGETYGFMDGFNQERQDLWLVAFGHGDAPVPLTDGSHSRRSFFDPKWSPDGERLAFLSLKDDSDIKLMVWERRSGRIAQVASANISIHVNFGAQDRLNRSSYAWLDSGRIAAAVLPAGQAAPWISWGSYFDEGMAGFRKTKAGRAAAVSAIQAGQWVPGPSEQLMLMVYDVATGNEETLLSDAMRTVVPAPDGSMLAVTVATEPKLIPADSTTNYEFGNSYYAPKPLMHHRVLLVPTAGGGHARPVPGVFDPNTHLPTLFPRWSADGRFLAVLGYPSRAASVSGAAFSLYRVEAESARVRHVGEEVSSFSWWREDLIGLTRAGWRRFDADSPTRHGAPIAGADALQSRLQRLRPADHAPLFAVGQVPWLAGLGQGHLLRFDERDNAFVQGASLGDGEARVAWPSTVELVRGHHRQIVVEIGGRLLLASPDGPSEFHPLQRPSEDAILLAFSPRSGNTLFVDQGGDELALWTGRAVTGRLEKVVVFNLHWRAIGDPVVRLVAYQDGSGEKREALVMLPEGYDPRRAYPTIVHVYPGLEFTEPRNLGSKRQATFLNDARFTSAGYVVLRPSIPVARSISEWRAVVRQNVLASMDRMIELGISDPERFGLFGHSFGSLAALSLLRDTDRFKAAITAATYANLSDYVGFFDHGTRYHPDAEVFGLMRAAEPESPEGRLKLSVSPYQDMRPYVELSPTFHTEDIRTPLMLVHGEFDWTPMSSAEALFQGLRRRGRDVTFVRYWSEGHLLKSPANIEDFWDRSNAWFSRHLQAPGDRSSGKGTFTPPSGP